jgi:hypothetical protein
MSSLWTPDGEHRVEREVARPSAGAPAEDEPGDGEAQAAFAQLEQQLLSVPAADVIANHCYGMFELAALHLSQNPPRLAEARLAIDALSAIVETLGSRLGESAPTLQEGIAQIRLAFVQLAGPPGASAAGADEQPEGGETL